MSKFMVFQCEICHKQVSYQNNTIQELKSMIGLAPPDNTNVARFISVPLVDADIHLCNLCFGAIQSVQSIMENPIITEKTLTQEQKIALKEQWYERYRRA